MQFLKYIIVAAMAATLLAGASSYASNTQQPANAQLASQKDAAAVTVYVTRTGEKYHCDGCQYLRQSRIAVSLADAVAQGYGACSVCDPPYIESDSSITVYRTKTGEKYHERDCQYLENRETVSLTLKDAKRKGLKRCAICEPPR